MSHASSPPPPPSPPLGGPFLQHQPPPPPPPSRGKRGVVVALVSGLALMLVAAAVVLVVVAPWDDDPTTAADRSESGDAAEGPADGPVPDEPVPDEPVADLVTGDIDGDGLGDAQFAIGDPYEGAGMWTFTSTGTAFTVEEGTEQILDVRRLRADWDGDGDETYLDLTHGEYSSEGIEIGLVGEEHDETRFVLPSWIDADDVGYSLTAGDFDGDRLPDLAMWTETSRCTVTVSVMRGTGAGFDAPVEWGVIERALRLDTNLLAADVGADGTADLVGVVADEITDDLCGTSDFYGDHVGIVLTSTGSSFDVGAPSPDASVSSGYWNVVGDFSGAGDPMVASLAGHVIDVLRFGAEGPVDAGERDIDLGEELEATGLGLPEINGMSASDVDGDGDDDLVLTVFDSEEEILSAVWVVRSEGQAWAEPEPWVEPAVECGFYCYATEIGTSG